MWNTQPTFIAERRCGHLTASIGRAQRPEDVGATAHAVGHIVRAAAGVADARRRAAIGVEVRLSDGALGGSVGGLVAAEVGAPLVAADGDLVSAVTRSRGPDPFAIVSAAGAAGLLCLELGGRAEPSTDSAADG